MVRCLPFDARRLLGESGEEALQRFRLDGFYHVGIEAGFSGAAAVFLLTVARKGREAEQSGIGGVVD